MRGAIPPLPQYVFLAWRLIKHRDNVTLPLRWVVRPPSNLRAGGPPLIGFPLLLI